MPWTDVQYFRNRCIDNAWLLQNTANIQQFIISTFGYSISIRNYGPLVIRISHFAFLRSIGFQIFNFLPTFHIFSRIIIFIELFSISISVCRCRFLSRSLSASIQKFALVLKNWLINLKQNSYATICSKTFAFCSLHNKDHGTCIYCRYYCDCKSFTTLFFLTALRFGSRYLWLYSFAFYFESDGNIN